MGQFTRCRLGLALGDREEEGDASAPNLRIQILTVDTLGNHVGA